MSSATRGVVPAYAVAVSVSGRMPAVVPTQGAGLLVGPDHVLTCLHTLLMADPAMAGRRDMERRSLNEALPSAVSFVVQTMPDLKLAVGVGNRGDMTVDATFVAEDRKNDLALLKLPAPVYGLVPPPVAEAGARGRLVSFGWQMDRFSACDHGANGPGAEVAVDGWPVLRSYAHGAPPGYSGGPVVVVDEAGAHRLVGLTLFGGLVSAEGAYVPVATIQPFLATWGLALPHRPEAGPLPGIAAQVDIPVTDAVHRPFRAMVVDGRIVFRAVGPLTVSDPKQSGRRPAAASSLPVHLATAEAATALRATLFRHRSGQLRLPTAGELDHVAALSGSAAAPSLGLPLRLADWGSGDQALATPLGGAEWGTEPDGRITLFRRDRRTRTIEAWDPVAAHDADGSLRFAFQPVFQPGPLHVDG